jgi:hypothetical protein
VLLEGYLVDVDAQAEVARAAGLADAEGPPELPTHRAAVAPGAIRDLAAREGRFVAEVGVGTVHCEHPPAAAPVDPVIAELHARLKAEFDPSGRCNPGRDPLLAAAGVPA